MKVLHIAAGNLFGGVETILVTLAAYRHLCAAMQTEFALCYEGRLSEELRKTGAPVHVLGPARFSRPWSILGARRRLRNVLIERQIDVAICHSSWPLALFGGAVRTKKKKLAMWLHSPVQGSHWTERLARRQTPDLVLSVSRDTDASLLKLFPVVAHEIFYTPLPPGADAFTAAARANCRAEFGVAQDAVVIVQASRLEAWKGHRQHLEALAEIQDVPGWVCWFAGGAQRPHEEVYLAELKNACTRLGLSGRVRFLGQRSDVIDVLRAADIYCQPNTGPEGFSIVFVEACLARLPIVTSALGGALEIVDADSGILTPPGDAAAVAKSLRLLLNDPPLRKRLGNAAHDRVRRMCDPAAQMDRLYRMLERVCESGGVRPILRPA